jgi:hypothetical protein
MRAMAMLAVLVAVMASGCVSAYTVRKNNEMNVEESVVRAQAIPGGAALSVNLSAVPRGYAAAWRADPGGMALSTAADAIIAGGVGYLLYDSLSGDDGGGSDAPAIPPIRQSGRGNLIQIGTGNDGQGGGRTDSHDAAAPEAAP